MQRAPLPVSDPVNRPVPGIVAAGAAGFPALQRIREIERLVQTLVASWHHSPTILQTRRWHRICFCKPICITPLDVETERPLSTSRTVTGKDLSLGGISFIHDDPLPFRKVAVTFAGDGHGATESIVTRLTWCRFTREGLYRSGGKFLRTVDLSVG